MNHHTRFAALAFAALLAVAACSSSATSASPAPASVVAPAASAAAGSAVSIANFSFQPATITVAVGSTVTWTNNDSTNHTVTADDGSFKSGPIAAGATFSQAFAKAGTFAYHCSIHTSMTATVVVQ
jgi:plastocyanin